MGVRCEQASGQQVMLGLYTESQHRVLSMTFVNFLFIGHGVSLLKRVNMRAQNFEH